MTHDFAQFVTAGAVGERDSTTETRSATDTAFSAALERLEAFGRFSIHLFEFPVDRGGRPPQDLNGALGRFREFLDNLS